MAGIWIYSEEKQVADQLISIGRITADSLKEELNVIALTDQDSETFIKEGADRVIQIKDALPWPEDYAKTITAILKEQAPTAVLIGGTLRGKTAASYIAANLQTGLVNNAFSIEVKDGIIETKRVMYSGIAVCTEELSQGSIITIEPRTYDSAAADEKRQGTTEVYSAEQPDAAVSVGSIAPVVHQGGDITTADKLVCVGRGLGKQEDMKMAEELAEKLGAQIGCTRSVAEDYHWLSADKYIGLSGAKIKPQLYISMGVSGQVQHVAGMRDSKIIAAIDKNENAPIFEAADYGIVGDLYEIVPLLIKELEK